MVSRSTCKVKKTLREQAEHLGTCLEQFIQKNEHCLPKNIVAYTCFLAKLLIVKVDFRLLFFDQKTMIKHQLLQNPNGAARNLLVSVQFIRNSRKQIHTTVMIDNQSLSKSKAEPTRDKEKKQKKTFYN